MIIDHCYEGVIAKLTAQGTIKEMSIKLLSLVNNDERVLYVYEILENLSAFPKVEKVNKSEKVSTYYRNLGNQCYQNKDNYKAWQYYNKSLLHAPLKSDAYILAVANRSAILFALRKYKECIIDIEKVFSMGYPEKLKEKLAKRKQMCDEFLVKEQNVAEDFNSEIIDISTLKGSRDPRYPCVSTKLQVVFNKELGRHVVAKEDIKVGEVLIEENPYFTLIVKDQILFSCNYCLNRTFNLYPCDFCCYTLYCSEGCQEAAWKDYHQVECPLICTLIDMNFTKLELLSLRTVIRARNDQSDWNSLLQTVEAAEANVHTEFRGHMKVNGEWVYDSRYYPAIHTLETNVDKRSVSDIFQKALTAAVFLKFLSDETDFLQDKDKTLEENIRRFVGGALLLHIMTSVTNMHGITSNIQTQDGRYVVEVSLASAAYAFHSLLNHSCAPNIVRFTKLGSATMSTFALRPIKKGMQIYDNYGAHHALQSRHSRQSGLMFQYKFKCMCEACVDDWPMFLNMAPTKRLPPKVSRLKNKLLKTSVIDKLEKGDKQTAVSLFSRLCRLCEELEPYGPCLELCECQESLKQCLLICQGMVPYGHTQVINWEDKPPEHVLN